MARNRNKTVKVQPKTFNNGETCYICQSPVNRRAKPVGPNGELVCGTCRQQNGL